MVRAVGENTFQPKIGFKTRYGIVSNPFADGARTGEVNDSGRLQTNNNRYYRRVKVQNLMWYLPTGIHTHRPPSGGLFFI